MSQQAVNPPRTCGSCTHCCKVMAIDELEKPMGVVCRHVAQGKGCAIHGQHPPSCRAFACVWLLEPRMPHRLRPDQTKVVLVADGPQQNLVAYCDPSNPFAWRRDPMYSLLKRQAFDTWATQRTVVAKAGRRLWLITPKGDVEIGELAPGALYDVRKFPDGKAEVTVETHPSPGIAGARGSV